MVGLVHHSFAGQGGIWWFFKRGYPGISLGSSCRQLRIKQAILTKLAEARKRYGTDAAPSGPYDDILFSPSILIAIETKAKGRSDEILLKKGIASQGSRGQLRPFSSSTELLQARLFTRHVLE